MCRLFGAARDTILCARR